MITRNIEILAPTFLEYWAVRHTLPHASPNWAGVGLTRWKGVRQGTIVVICGLAGALAPDLTPGTILIPDQVALADGSSMHCDAALVRALVAAAHTLHFQPHTGPLLTDRSLVVGDNRDAWFQRGFVAADMETGLLMRHNLRVATIRVVLDTPANNISPAWLQPTKALRQPALWQELLWLSRMAPGYALRAARVLKIVLDAEPGNMLLVE